VVQWRVQGLPAGYDNVSVLQRLLEGTDKVVCCRDCLEELIKWCAAGTA